MRLNRIVELRLQIIINNNLYKRHIIDEIIVSKIDDDRYIIKLDIYLNLLGNELPKIKGARHIGGVTSDDTLYLENQTCDTIEIKRAIDNPNRYTYNVYLKNI